MSLNIQEEKCVVCKAYLFEEDDVVYCPECGAPHHRECYNSIDKCGLQELHGTEHQYKKIEKNNNDNKSEHVDLNLTTCAVCGEKYNLNEATCPECDAPNISKMNGKVFALDFMGGVPSDTDLGDGVTADEVKKFVASNTHRYIPKFLKFKNGKKSSWNWLAFLLPCGWFFSRKMYLLGSVVGAFQIAFAMLSIPFVNATNQLDLSAAKNSFEIAQIIMENISIVGEEVIYIATIGSFLNLIIAVLSAVFGDYIYRNRVISSISEIKRSNLDKDETFRKKGGINFIAAILGYFAVNELPTIIAYLLGML